MTNQTNPNARPPNPPFTSFRSGHEMRLAMKDARRRLGDWRLDPVLMSRIEATPLHIQSETR